MLSFWKLKCSPHPPTPPLEQREQLKIQQFALNFKWSGRPQLCTAGTRGQTGFAFPSDGVLPAGGPPRGTSLTQGALPQGLGQRPGVSGHGEVRRHQAGKSHPAAGIQHSLKTAAKPQLPPVGSGSKPLPPPHTRPPALRP